MGNINVNLTYPYNSEYDFTTVLERIDLDKECKKDLENNKGFIISSPQSTKKELKNPEGIYSSKYGATLQDINAYADRYKCDCGHTTSRIENGNICKICHTPVRYVDDDFEYFGWMVLNRYTIIHPAMYKSIEFLIGSTTLNNIINIIDEKDQDGFSIKREPNKDEPYLGLGMIEFAEKFDEIIDYYYNKSKKLEQYNDIKKNRDIVFTHSIPVYTTHLRPYAVDGNNYVFEGTNSLYNMMSNLVYQINKEDLMMYRKKKTKDQLLYDLQMKLYELYTEIEKILSGKAGNIRKLFGGRYNFTSRDVIVGNNNLRIDQITLPYMCMIEWLQMPIINILNKSYSFGYNKAYEIWYAATVNFDPLVYNIIKDIINNHPDGGPLVVINRNPTISYGGILAMHVVDITNDYTMGIPLQPLPLLAADFDGDVLNVLYVINKTFGDFCNRIFGPRNAMYIDRNNGYFNTAINHSKDIIINSTTLMRLAKPSYTQEELNIINSLKG